MVGCATSTSYTDTGLLNGKTYYYVVSATYGGNPNAGGESRNSIEASAMPVSDAPLSPTGLTATPGNGQVALSWNASSGASSYNVKRGTINGGPYTTIASPFSTNHTDSGLSNGTTYYYVVSAVNSGGEGPNSSQVSATPQASVPTLTSLSPSSATAGGAAFTLTVNGGNFVSGAVVRWNGANRTTTFINATQLTAAIPAGDIAKAGTPQVTVFNPPPGGGTSNALTFTVNASLSGVVAAYSLNEGAGSTVADASGNNNTGTISGATWTTLGQYGNALSFNGVNNYVNIPANSPVGSLTSNLTMSAWVYLNNLTSVHTIWDTAESPFSNRGLAFKTLASTGRLELTTKGVKDYSSLTASVPTGVWTHVAVVLNSAFAATFFVNGVQKDTITHTVGGNANTTQATFIGGAANDGVNPVRLWMDGRIDNLRIYNRALSLAEIQNDMNTPIGAATNTAPTISTFAAQSTNEDTASSAIAFTVGDNETTAGSLTVSGSSSNTTLVPNANIVFGGSGANRTVTLTPAANQNGTATITVTVSDGQLSTPTSFLLTVNAVNDPPTITTIANQSTTSGTAVGPINFTVGDAETTAGSLTVSGTSSNTTLVPNANIVFGGTGANRTVTVTPAAAQTGTATITVTVSDSQLNTPTSFLLTVNATNTAPTISTIAAQSTNEDTASSAIAFTVGDNETTAGSLTVSGTSSNTTLVPNANIVFGGSGANRTVTVTPAANQNGTATITVTVSDGQLSTPTSFLLTVNAVNDAPTITGIANQTTTTGAPVGPLNFTIGDAETAAGSLTVSGSSNNTTLVPNANITFGGSGANRTVTVTPATAQTGTATITVTVSDGLLSTPTSFVVSVNASPSGLVAAYSFNEGGGSALGDSSGSNNTGTISGATWTTLGQYGNALSFGGVNNYVNIPANSSIGSLTSNFSMSAWVYLNNLTTLHTIWDTAESPFTNRGLAFKTLASTGRLELTTKGVKDYSSLTASVPTGVWTHVAVVLNSAFAATFFVNGVQKDTITHTVGGNANTTQATFIGGAANDGVNPVRFWMDGRIDNLRIYNRALTLVEIQNDMNTPIGTATNTAPTISTIAAQSTNEDTASSAIAFTVGDGETAPGSLTVSGTSNNTTLVPNANIVFGGSGANRTVTVTPALNQTGTATITVTVSDGQLSTPTSFLLTVNAVNDAPTITTIANQSNHDRCTGGAAQFHRRRCGNRSGEFDRQRQLIEHDTRTQCEHCLWWLGRQSHGDRHPGDSTDWHGHHHGQRQRRSADHTDKFCRIRKCRRLQVSWQRTRSTKEPVALLGTPLVATTPAPSVVPPGLRWGNTEMPSPSTAQQLCGHSGKLSRRQSYQ